MGTQRLRGEARSSVGNEVQLHLAAPQLSQSLNAVASLLLAPAITELLK